MTNEIEVVETPMNKVSETKTLMTILINSIKKTLKMYKMSDEATKHLISSYDIALSIIDPSLRI